jgi:hypothetical protein
MIEVLTAMLVCPNRVLETVAENFIQHEITDLTHLENGDVFPYVFELT